MVLPGGLDIGRDPDPAEVDLLAQQFEPARTGKVVPLVHVAQVVDEELGREVGRIRVPVKQVERRGLLAEQVVVDHEVPDQVVGAERVEGPRHVRRVEIALLPDLRFQRVHVGFVGEDAELAGILEVDLGGEEGGGADPIVANGVHVGERGGEQRAADAIADRGRLAFPGRPLDGVERREEPIPEIVVEGEARVALVRVDP